MHIDAEAMGQSNFSFRLDPIRIYATKWLLYLTMKPEIRNIFPFLD
jgi:hypothetical protein